MGDSDDGSTGPRREKFQRERGEPRGGDQYDRRGGGGRDRDWSRDRSRGGGGSWGGQSSGMPSDIKNNSRGMGGNPRDSQARRVEYPPTPHSDMKRRYEPDHDADLRGRKRMRGGAYDSPPAWGEPPAAWNNMPSRPPYDHPRGEFSHQSGPPRPMEPDMNGPSMYTFKAWLNMQSDDISDEDAVANYNVYKVNFRRQQLQEFFVAHKDEEWFKEKYHPDESAKRFKDQRSGIVWRAQVYKKMREQEFIDGVHLDLQNEKDIIKLLDKAVIFMEGGEAEDLNVLNISEAADGDEAKANEESKESENGDATAKTFKGSDEKKKDYQGYDDDDSDHPSEGGDDVPPGMEKQSNDSNESPQEPAADADSAAAATTGDTVANGDKKNGEDGEVKDLPQPRALHRTHSIFMRNLPPIISKNEVANLCKRFEGFVRVTLSPPDANQFTRRCWVTFKRDVNIKDICWNLNRLRVRDAELNPVVNRDLTRRVRAVSGISQHSACARNDLRNIARLIDHLDSKWKLWETEEGAPGENPWMRNISDYLVDEASAEEDELLGGVTNAEKKVAEESAPVDITRDDQLIKVLDRLLYYLRIVHSVDYYNATEYPCEDEMPNRCGIIHARGQIPPNQLTKKDIEEFQKRFSQKLSMILNFKEKLTEEEAKKLGPKDSEAEVEKFITSNTQELETDKWLCPLSGKKFKGKEYIRKHILNKHKDKVDAVRDEVKFFNNYLLDPRRPGPSETAPKSQPGTPNGPMHGGAAGPMPRGYPHGPPAGYRGRPQYTSPQFQQRPQPNNPYNSGGRSYPPKGRDNNRGGDSGYRSRNRVPYHDLDAPDESEDFF